MTKTTTVTGTIIDGPEYTPMTERVEAETSFTVATDQSTGPVDIEVHGMSAEQARYLRQGDRVAVVGAVEHAATDTGRTKLIGRQVALLASQKGATLRGVFDRSLDAAQPTNAIDAPRR